MKEEEICKCGHRRFHHKISDSSCKFCECDTYRWDISLKKYSKTLSKVFEKCPPEKYGGCMIATRMLIEEHPELKEKIYHLGTIKHSVGELPDGRIIDTQLFQIGLIRDLKGKEHKIVFEKEEFDTLMKDGSYNYLNNEV